MTTHPEDNILILFTNGRLQEEEEDALELHLSVCGECRARLERIEHLGMETDPFLEEIKTAANLRLPDELYEGCILRNQFHLEKKLGSGGIGVIWKALEEHVHRHVVLKFVKMNTGRVAQSTNNLREMFHKVQMLQHSNICPLYDMFDDEQHGLYLVMKYIEGETLEDYRKRKGTLSLEEAVKILWPVALGLDYAHSRRVIHRDIKPQNILISASEDGVQIIDFDLADTFRDSLASSTSIPSVKISGTRPFMAPEQWQGRLHFQTDQYALAVTAYELLSGTLPFVGNDIEVLCQAILYIPPAPIPNLPDHVNNALLRGLAKQPTQRFASCCDFIFALADSRLDDSRQPETQPTSDPPLQPVKENYRLWYYSFGLVGVIAAILFSWLIAFYIVLPGAIDKMTRRPPRPEPVDIAVDKSAGDKNAGDKTAGDKTAGDNVPVVKEPVSQESVKLPRRNELFRTIRVSLSVDTQGIVELNMRNGLSSDLPDAIRGIPFPFDAMQGAIGLRDPNGSAGRVLFPLGVIGAAMEKSRDVGNRERTFPYDPTTCEWHCRLSGKVSHAGSYSRFTEGPGILSPALFIAKAQSLPLTFTFDVVNNVSEAMPDFGIILYSSDQRFGNVANFASVTCSGRRLSNGTVAFSGSISTNSPRMRMTIPEERPTSFHGVELPSTGAVSQRLFLPEGIASHVTKVEYSLGIHNGMVSDRFPRAGFDLTFLDISGHFFPSIGISKETPERELSMESVSKQLPRTFFIRPTEKIVGLNGTSDKGEIKKLLNSMRFGDPITINLVDSKNSDVKRVVTIYAQ